MSVSQIEKIDMPMRCIAHLGKLIIFNLEIIYKNIKKRKIFD